MGGMMSCGVNSSTLTQFLRGAGGQLMASLVIGRVRAPSAKRGSHLGARTRPLAQLRIPWTLLFESFHDGVGHAHGKGYAQMASPVPRPISRIAQKGLATRLPVSCSTRLLASIGN